MINSILTHIFPIFYSRMAYNTSYLDELVAEYLTYRGFFNTLKAFKQEQKQDKSKSFNVDKIVDFLLQLTTATAGDFNLLRATWQHLTSTIFSRLPDPLLVSSAQRLEVALYKLYLVHAFQNSKKEKIAEFFSTMSPVLLNNENGVAWKEWLAFPYVAQPATQAPFAICFTRPWQDSVSISLANLLMISFNAIPKPRLVQLIEQITKMEHEEANNLRSSQLISEVINSNKEDPTNVKPSRRLLSFFSSNKTSNSSLQVTSNGQLNNNDSFRRTKSQSSFPRHGQSLPVSERIGDLPPTEGPIGEEENLLETSQARNSSVVFMKTRDEQTRSDDEMAFHDAKDNGESLKPDEDSLSFSQSLPAVNYLEKVAERNRHRKKASMSKFTYLDLEKTEIPGCQGGASIKCSFDGRYIGVLSHSAQTVFVFCADALASRGVIASALISSPPSCFAIGSQSTRPASDPKELIIAVGSSSSAKLLIFRTSSEQLNGTKYDMVAKQLFIVNPVNQNGKQTSSISCIEIVNNHPQLAICAIAQFENNDFSSSIAIVSLTEQQILRRFEARIPDLITSITTFEREGKLVQIGAGDGSGSVHFAKFVLENETPSVLSELRTLKIDDVKIEHITITSNDQALVCDETGKLTLVTISLLKVEVSCDDFAGDDLLSCCSTSPEGSSTALLADGGTSIYLINCDNSSQTSGFGSIVTQLPDEVDRERMSPDFVAVTWTPAVLQTALTHIAGVTKGGELILYRLLT